MRRSIVCLQNRRDTENKMTQQEIRLWQVPAPSVDAVSLRAKEQELAKRLEHITSQFNSIRFATSLAAEDMVLTDALQAKAPKIEIFTLQTGRLHAETLAMIERTEAHYGLRIERYEPEQPKVQAFIERFGLNGFYESEEAKKACCHARKVEPLARALKGAQAWLSGQRREQAATREELTFEEWDAARGMAKFNPLYDWTQADIWSYLQTHQVPLHPLHKQGYPSIGCEPCTRPIRETEDVRAGRWWWLQKESKECGLHK
jgi:phosphoadenosine phosphosulfate reductase